MSTGNVSRVYIDGVFDLFHRGHLEAFRKAKHVRRDVFLIVGLIDDKDTKQYKRSPIYNEADRYQLISSIEFVDQVIFPAPLILDEAFLERHHIDIVVHGFSDSSDYAKQAHFFQDIQHKFETIPYFPYASTSQYIADIIQRERMRIKHKHRTVSTSGPGTDDESATNTVCYGHHGGQAVHADDCEVRVDLSVTTNGLGPVSGYFGTKLDARRFEELVDHYPPMDDTEMRDAYWSFVLREHQNAHFGDAAPRVLFGNGASELIDLVIRSFRPDVLWKTNQVDVQYREYFNSCSRRRMRQAEWSSMDVQLTIMINPNNPTGQFLAWEECVAFVETHVPPNSTLLVDESMLFWHGPRWLDHSFLGHPRTLQEWHESRGIDVIVVQSWTKLFACTGLRVGSVVLFDPARANLVARDQVPWSLNAVGRDYILHAWKQQSYLDETWDKTRAWRSALVHEIQTRCPHWTVHGSPWISWIWIDTGNDYVVDLIDKKSRSMGYPIRHGKHGYLRPTFFRIGVRDPETIRDWLDGISAYKNVEEELATGRCLPENLVLARTTLSQQQILIHENYIEHHVSAFYEYLKLSGNYLIPTILVAKIDDDDESIEGDAQYLLVDGHHRFEVLKRLEYSNIPVTVIDYSHESIHTNLHTGKQKIIDKQRVVESALSGTLLPPKTTRHVIQISDNKYLPIAMLSENSTLFL